MLEKIFINICTPFVALKVLIRDSVITSKEKNAIRSGKPLSGLKKGKLSKDYHVSELKKVSRKHNVTINDMLMTVTSVSIK